LKKRLKQNQANTETILQSTNCNSNSTDLDVLPSHQAYASMSPQPSSSDFSSVTDASVTTNSMSHVKGDDMDLSESFPEIDESLWSELPLAETTTSNMLSDLLAVTDESQAQSQFNPLETVELGYNYDSISTDDDMDFWYNLFIRAGGSAELSEF
jgi:myb proto-oncogene protein